MKDIKVIISRFPSMPRRYYYTLIINNVQRSKGRDAGRNAGEAAAKAMELANAYAGHYLILAPSEVLAHIPLNKRTGESK